MRPFRRSGAAALAVLAALLIAGTARAQAPEVTRFVSPTGSDALPNDGTSPALAWRTLGKALTELSSPTGSTFNSIHLAKGSSTDVYTPGAGPDDTFLVTRPVTIRGGYTFTLAGGAWTESRGAGDMSTLSGAIPGGGHNRHIMTVARMHERVELDGLRFTGGDARGYTQKQGNRGGAIFASEDTYGGEPFDEPFQAGPLVIKDCSFEENAAHTGGAIEANQWRLAIQDSRFVGNVVSGNPPSGVGGGNVEAWGGAIDVILSELHVKRTLFQGNSLTPSTTSGGGGGAISVQYEAQSSLICANCTFLENSCKTNVPTARNEGGAVFATHGGGDPGSYVVPQFINCVFKGNTASVNGGALSCRYGALVLDCTLSENDAATGAGGGFYGALKGGSTTVFRNSVFWGNTAAVAFAAPAVSGTVAQYQYALGLSTNPITISHTCVEASSVVAGTGNTNLDPLFADADLRLGGCSPLVDLGSAGELPADALDVDEDASTAEDHPLDLDGTTRVKGAQVDMGAYERPEPACRADLDGSGVVDGTDLGLLLGSWGACAGCPADQDCSGVVDGTDLGLLLGSWGACGGGFMMRAMHGGGEDGVALLCQYLGVEGAMEAGAALSQMDFESMTAVLEAFLGD